jgi:hypothetical protein
MSAKAIIPPARVAALLFWDRFHLQADLRVRQLNELAGEVQWIFRSSGPFSHQITLEAAARHTHRVECSFDLDRCILCFHPGPALQMDDISFHWGGGDLEILEGERGESSLEAILNSVLSILTGKTATAAGLPSAGTPSEPGTCTPEFPPAGQSRSHASGRHIHR